VKVWRFRFRSADAIRKSAPPVNPQYVRDYAIGTCASLTWDAGRARVRLRFYLTVLQPRAYLRASRIGTQPANDGATFLIQLTQQFLSMNKFLAPIVVALKRSSRHGSPYRTAASKYLQRRRIPFAVIGVASLIQSLAFAASAPVPEASPSVTATATPALLDGQTYDRLLGSYRFSSGDLIVIGRSSRALYYYEPQTRRVRAMERSPESSADKEEWIAGPSLLVYSPVESRITFQKNEAGEIISLAFADGTASPQIAQKADLYREERISFPTKGATLAGSLLLPKGPGPHPAIVCVHGSGRPTILRGMDLRS
jgi:hypothetical protein